MLSSIGTTKGSINELTSLGTVLIFLITGNEDPKDTPMLGKKRPKSIPQPMKTQKNFEDMCQRKKLPKSYPKKLQNKKSDDTKTSQTQNRLQAPIV